MSQSIRFLGFAILTWAGVRALSLGLIPGTEALASDAHRQPSSAAATAIPPLPATRFDPVEPVAPAGYAMPPGAAGGYAAPPPYGYAPYAGYPAPAAYPYPVYVPVQQPVAVSYRQSPPAPRYTRFVREPLAPLDETGGGYSDLPYDMAFRSTPSPTSSAPVRPAVQVTPTFRDDAPTRGYDRWQLSSWAMMRSRPGPAALAANGMIGGSQAGARILYRFDPRLGVSVRTTSALQSTQQGVEIAAGLRAQPFRAIPAAITIERRQWVGKGIGRSDFAVFAEGGVWGKSLPMNFRLDGYLQAGVVGIGRRDWFVDGSAAATRPLWRNLSGGFGVWGGAQQGLTRFDAGPRLTFDMGRGMKVHADYRAKLVGNAQPGSGGVITLAGDF